MAVKQVKPPLDCLRTASGSPGIDDFVCQGARDRSSYCAIIRKVNSFDCASERILCDGSFIASYYTESLR